MATPLTGISSTAWEHPADRAALQTLRALPGFDEVVRKVAGFFGERGVRQLFLANAVGHIMSGHTTYSTIAIILLTIGLRNLPILAGVALLPFQLALLEWYRKAEFSADRAGLLGVQDPEAAMRLYLRMAGGAPKGDEENLEEFLVQAEEYEANTGAMDLVWKVINTAFRDHPFATVRAAELNRWVKSGEYQRIVDGDYPRRGRLLRRRVAQRRGLGERHVQPRARRVRLGAARQRPHGRQRRHGDVKVL